METKILNIGLLFMPPALRFRLLREAVNESENFQVVIVWLKESMNGGSKI